MRISPTPTIARALLPGAQRRPEAAVTGADETADEAADTGAVTELAREPGDG